MAQHLTREQILARKIGHGTYTLRDGSGTVKIRALTRDDAIRVQEAEGMSEQENMVVHLGLVDPALSLDDVRAWAAADDAGTLNGLSEEIGILSRLREGAGKRGVPGAGV